MEDVLGYDVCQYALADCNPLIVCSPQLLLDAWILCCRGDSRELRHLGHDTDDLRLMLL